MEPQEQNQQNKKRIPRGLKIAAIIAGAIIIYYTVSMVYAYIKIQRGDVVKWGGAWYTKEELAQKFPPQYYEAEAKNTPEEVYTAFRQALIDSDLELALEQISEEHRETFRKILSDEGNMREWGGKIPEKITKEEESGNYASYDINMGTENKNNVRFIKDLNGYWKIENI
ncbi:MAG: hypothetical protein NUV61_00495 [Candidatus Azambacteria bacterium]|nr:hypothetical protein [Candidatus Azambacteria bacterium]